jgi:lysophospholipase L1-like esterase
MTLQWNLGPAENLWYRFSEEVGWERRPNFIGHLNDRGDHATPTERGLLERRFDRQGYHTVDSVQVVDNHEPKILAFGDSSTFGLGVPTKSSYVEVLDALLPNTSVINLGVTGYTSYQGYKAFMKYVPELKPMMAIVSFQYNDRRYVLPDDGIDSDIKFHRYMSWHRIDLLRDWLYMYRYLSSLMEKVGLINKPKFAELGSLNELAVRVPPESYRHNLVRIAEIARDRKIPLIFMVLKDHPLMTEHLNRGLALLEKLQFDAAVKELTIAIYLHKGYSDLARKHLALAYEKRGELEEAKRLIYLDNPYSSLHGGHPLYRDVEYNEIMRSVAKEYDIKLGPVNT